MTSIWEWKPPEERKKEVVLFHWKLANGVPGAIQFIQANTDFDHSTIIRILNKEGKLLPAIREWEEGIIRHVWKYGRDDAADYYGLSRSTFPHLFEMATGKKLPFKMIRREEGDYDRHLQRVKIIEEAIERGYSKSMLITQTRWSWALLNKTLKSANMEWPKMKRGKKGGTLCRIYHQAVQESEKKGDNESIFQDPDFMEEMFPETVESCYDYKKQRGKNDGP